MDGKQGKVHGSGTAGKQRMARKRGRPGDEGAAREAVRGPRKGGGGTRTAGPVPDQRILRGRTQHRRARADHRHDSGQCQGTALPLPQPAGTDAENR